MPGADLATGIAKVLVMICEVGLEGDLKKEGAP
jgi:hypothetical protein